MNAWSVLLGASVTAILSYFYVPRLVTHVEDSVRENLRDPSQKVEPRLPGGDIVGHLECVIFFASFVVMGNALLAGAWLVFKTAAKWKTWVPTPPNYVETQVRYRAFLIGTAANIVAALIGSGIAHLP